MSSKQFSSPFNKTHSSLGCLVSGQAQQSFKGGFCSLVPAIEDSKVDGILGDAFIITNRCSGVIVIEN
jgi:hypothetical protein